MIQTTFETLYVCEIKFSKNAVGMEVIQAMQKKIAQLKRPKGYSCRPVLIHVNGVTEDLVDSGYFSHMLNFGQLIESENPHSVST